MFSFFPNLTQNLFSLILSYVLMTMLPAGSSAGFGEYGNYLFLLLFVGFFIYLRYTAREKVVYDTLYKENAKANTAVSYYNNYIKAENAAKDIRLYSQSAAINEIFKESFNIKQWISIFFFFGRQQGFALGFNALISGGIYLLVGYFALDGGVLVGSVVQTVGAFGIFAGALGTFIYTVGRLWTNAAFLKPMREFLTLPDILVKGDKPVPGYSDGITPMTDSLYNALEIEFRNVSFRYPAAEDYALRNFSLKFTPGERIAVVGRNGSGKTTMIKLLCRLYDPTEGEILLNGINIKEYDYSQYIRLFSVVFQDFMLFPLWLGQNVATCEDFDFRHVMECLEGAGFSERLETMPDGLDTILYKTFDEDGTQISGGEAQKIALARALYKKSPIVILDEPTAALDPIAEYEVYTTFDETIGDRTAVFISHRLSSCRFCDHIAVFDSGKLIQFGTHDELLDDVFGHYHELWEAQASHYRDG
jgi:ATP-binding cassette subfamily B protein